MEKGSSSSSSSAAGGGPDSLNGLKFGKKIYFEGASAKTRGGQPPGPSSPAKKGRTGAVQGGGQPPRCQVEGCRVDLSDAKAYYSRHKVCGMHSKSPKVIVAGIEQRFCQQCSRFHQLPEFDQGKRSCRRRLAGHNERRRKPPPGSLLSSRYGSLSPSLFDNPSKTGGGFVMDFSNYPTLPARDSWSSGNQAATFTGKYQLQLPWQQHQSSSQNPPLPPDLLQARPGGFSGPSDDCFSGASVDSSSALSLLSNQQPWESRTRSSSSLGVSNFLGTTTNANGATLVQPSGGHFTCSSWGFKAGNQAGNSLHEMPPDLGLGQISHPSNSQYGGELGLAQPNEAQFHEVLDHSRGYAPSVQHMNWSL